MTVEEAVQNINTANQSFEDIIAIAKLLDNEDVWGVAIRAIRIPVDDKKKLDIIAADHHWRVSALMVSRLNNGISKDSLQWNEAVKAHHFETRTTEEIDDIVSRICKPEINFLIAIVRNGFVKDPKKLLELADKFSDRDLGLVILQTRCVTDIDDIIEIARFTTHRYEDYAGYQVWTEVKKILKSMIHVT